MEDIEELTPPRLPSKDELKDKVPKYAYIEHEDGEVEKFPLNFAAIIEGIAEIESEMSELSGINEELLS